MIVSYFFLIFSIISLVFDCNADLNVVVRNDGTFVSVYDCIKPSEPNVVDELCVASFALDSNGKTTSSVIRNIRFPSEPFKSVQTIQLELTPDSDQFPYIVITKKTEPLKSVDLILIRCLTATCTHTEPLWLTTNQYVFGPSLAFFRGLPYITYVTKESSDGETFTNPALQLIHCTKLDCSELYEIQIEQYATPQVYFGMTHISFDSIINRNLPIIGMLLQDRVDLYYCHDLFCNSHRHLAMHNNQTVMEFLFDANITALADSDQLLYCNMSGVDNGQGDDGRSCVPLYLDSTAAGRWISSVSNFNQQTLTVNLISAEHVYAPRVLRLSMYLIQNDSLVSTVKLFETPLSQDIIFYYTPPCDVTAFHSNRSDNNSAMNLLSVFKQYDRHTYLLYCFTEDCSNHTSAILFDDGSNVLVNNFTIVPILPSSSGSISIPMWIPIVAILSSVVCCLILIFVLAALYKTHSSRRRVYRRLPDDARSNTSSVTSFKEINS